MEPQSQTLIQCPDQLQSQSQIPILCQGTLHGYCDHHHVGAVGHTAVDVVYGICVNEDLLEDVV